MTRRVPADGTPRLHSRTGPVANSPAPGGHRPGPTKPPVANSGSAAVSDYAKLDETAALQSALGARAAIGLQQIIANSPREHLYEALSTKTPVDALIHIVSTDAVAALAATVMDDPLRAAKARAGRRMRDLLNAEGGPIGVDEAAALLRITRAAVDKRRRAGTLIGVGDGGRAILYPGWQFRDTGLLPGLDDVLRAMTIRDPWMRIEFFLSTEPDLAECPLDALREAKTLEVIAAAKRFGKLGEDG
jgi:hypothetical protein